MFRGKKVNWQSSRFIGVSWHKQEKRWRASIMVERKVHELGYFDNESDAANAFDVSEIKLRGTPRLLTSAHRGVSWAARPKRWRAQIRSNGVNKHIGYFKDEKSAHEGAASQPRLPTIVSTVDLVSMLEADPTDASRRMPRSRQVEPITNITKTILLSLDPPDSHR